MQADGRRGAGSDGMTELEDTVNPPMCDLSTLVLATGRVVSLRMNVRNAVAKIMGNKTARSNVVLERSA